MTQTSGLKGGSMSRDDTHKPILSLLENFAIVTNLFLPASLRSQVSHFF